MSPSKKRASYKQYKREANPETPFRLQERDLEILHQAALHRLIRTNHLLRILDATLAGGLTQRPLQGRLTKLFRHGYLHRVGEPERFGPNKARICALTNKGARVLNDHGHLPIAMRRFDENNKRLKDSNKIYHQLLITEFVTAVEAACQRSPDHSFISQHELLKGQEPALKIELKDSEQRRLIAIPDHIFGIRYHQLENKASYYYLEADRCSEDLSYSPYKPTIEGKVRTYLETYSQGRAAKRFKPIDLPTFQVLFLVEEKKRKHRHNLASVRDTHARVSDNGKLAPNLFLFKRHQDDPDYLDKILEQPWVNGKGERVMLSRD